MPHNEQRIGSVTHYYPRVHAAAVRLEAGPLHIGDRIHVVGKGVDFEQRVTSLQLDHAPIEEGRPGQVIGVAVKDRAPADADVFRIEGGGFWQRLFRW